MKLALKTALAGLLALAALPMTADAAPRHEAREEAIQKLKALREDLELTDAQQDQVRAILKSHRPALRAQWNMGRDAREAMRKATKAHGPESAEARAAASEVGNAARVRSLLVAKIATEIRPILSPAQREKAEAARLDLESWIQAKLDAPPLER